MDANKSIICAAFLSLVLALVFVAAEILRSFGRAFAGLHDFVRSDMRSKFAKICRKALFN